MKTAKMASQFSYMKGMSLDLPFVRFRYLKVEGDASNKSRSAQKTNRVIPDIKNSRLQGSIRIDNITSPEIPTLGHDPMVSKASVIHELAYGRTEANTSLPRKKTYYNPQLAYRDQSLDIIA
ncbi:MAG: hypothetical protein U9P49_11055 [Thermodesulfobacteriota bacterium]|nr:hypothetical protein [Thermodesulfobacteriota bacterium]